MAKQVKTIKSKLEIFEVPIDKIIPAEYNPRAMTVTESRALDESMEEFGMVEPGVLNMHPDRMYRLVGGHQRMLRWQARGNKTFPCVYVKIATEEKEKELNVRLNRNTGHWDYEKLANHYNTDDLLSWGFTDTELGGVLRSQESDIKFDDEAEPNFDQSGEEDTGHVRQVQLFFDNITHPEFMAKVEALSKHFETTDLTGTITKIVEESYARHISNGE